jgi:hypothetical protein
MAKVNRKPKRRRLKQGKVIELDIRDLVYGFKE